ncbi:MAG: hypothetical protein JWN46_840 [Acidimicrobiales bacterium]|nr:hypothetical protein [Acidimicrobiales bacterium]
MLRLPFLPFRLVRTFVKVVGFKNTLFLLIGVAIGLLVAPTTGAELRAKLADQLAGRPPVPPEPVIVAVEERDLDVDLRR